MLLPSPSAGGAGGEGCRRPIGPASRVDAPSSWGYRNHVVIQTLGYVPADSSAPSLDATFAALADPTRRAILARLAQGEASVMELAAPFAMSQPAVSKHLRVLERAGLVSRRRDRQRRPCRLEPRPLAQANAWLETYREAWESNFARLDGLLAELTAGTTTGPEDGS